MAIAATIEIPIESKEPREAVQVWVDTLLSKTIGAGDLQIDVALISMANKGVLTRLAENLPESALGFRALSSSDRAKSASEFLADANPSLWSYQGTLTEHLSSQKAIALIQDLIACSPQAIRSTSFILNCKKIRWKGSPTGSSGYLHLFDFKAFKRKQRFSLTVGLNCSGNAPKSTEVIASIKQVADSTGIAFHEGRICKVADETEDRNVQARAILLGQICFDEAVEVAADALDKQSGSKWSKSALSHREAFDLRLEKWGSGSSDKVNLASIAKRIVKTDLPELAFDISDADEIRFKKLLAGGAEMLVIFCKSLPRVGKAFTIEIGIQATDDSVAGVRFKANLFSLERTMEERSWIYSTSDEAVASVRIAIEAIKSMLPSFESALLSYFNPWPAEFPKQIRRIGNITAKEAFNLALPLVREQLLDARLIRLVNRSRSLAVRDAEGPELSVDGRLRENGLWWLHFYSETQDISIEVHVPATGRIRILDHGDRYKDANARHILEPINSEWVDSDESFRISEANGGQERRSSSKMFGIIAELNSWKYHFPCWELMYLVTDERGRNDLRIAIDASTGEIKPIS